MRTNYLQRNRRKNFLSKQVVIIALVFVLGALFFSLSSGVVSSALSPIWQGQNAASKSLANAISWTQSKDSLMEENSRLREELASREAELASLGASAAREAELLEMFGRAETKGGILAGVLVRPPETPYDMLIIDAGEREGVRVGQTVSMTEGPVLGKVVEVSGVTSKVELFSASGEKTSAVLERHSVPVILLGQGGGSFVLNLPRDIEVEAGDRILSADVFSKLLAVVSSVEMAPTDSFKKVLVKGASNIFTLRYVLVTP